MQTENLFEFLYIILDKKKVTAKEMAEHFGVSVRTIYRWVDSLCVSGVPLFMIKGKGGGISVSDSYSVDATVLNEDERISLVSSIKALRNLTGSNRNSAIDSVASKLGHLVKQNTDWINVDFAPWNPEGKAVRDFFDKLKGAILDSTQIMFFYTSQRHGPEQKTVQPWTLVFRGQSWYLYGFCNEKNEPRFFKLSRMRNLVVTTKKQTVEKKEIIQKDEAELYTKNNPLIEIKFIVKQKSLYRIYDELSYKSLTDNGDGTFCVCAMLPDCTWLINWILGFGSDIVILEPHKLRREVFDEANKIVLEYRNN